MPHSTTAGYRVHTDVLAFHAAHDAVGEVGEVHEDADHKIPRQFLCGIEHETKTSWQATKWCEDIRRLHLDPNVLTTHNEHKVVICGQFGVILPHRFASDMDLRLLDLFPEQVFPDFPNRMLLQRPPEAGSEPLCVTIMDQDRCVSRGFADEVSGYIRYFSHDASPFSHDAEEDDDDKSNDDDAYDHCHNPDYA